MPAFSAKFIKRRHFNSITRDLLARHIINPALPCLGCPSFAEFFFDAHMARDAAEDVVVVACVPCRRARFLHGDQKAVSRRNGDV